jgi:hypothetical protein
MATMRVREITGRRRRYRLLDLERLCWRLRTNDMSQVRPNLEAAGSGFGA